MRALVKKELDVKFIQMRNLPHKNEKPMTTDCYSCHIPQKHFVRCQTDRNGQIKFDHLIFSIDAPYL